MSTFTLSIKLGNDAMQSGDDISRALTIVAGKIASRYDGLHMPDDTGIIQDANGAKVGTWGVES